jgi:uncharacterized membrane protein
VLSKYDTRVSKKLSFSTIIFVSALWALSSEMIEDTFVNLIYGYMFGWRNLVYALLTASVILVVFSSFIVYYTLTYLLQYIALISKVSGILLSGIGLYWLISSLLQKRTELNEAKEELEKKEQESKRRLGRFLVALQFVSIEELEIVLVLVPLIITSHVLEASFAATIGIVISISTAAFFRKNFETFVKGKLRYLKILSGLFLFSLGLVIFFSA